MSDRQIELLQELNDAVSNKYSDYWIFYSKQPSFNIRFPDPIKLNHNRNYKIALHYFTTSNYLINITEHNNNFYYSIDIGKTWVTLIIEKGAYGIDQLTAEINRQMKDRKHFNNTEKEPKYFFKIGITEPTFKSYIEITNPLYQIDFTRTKTFKDILGFKSKVLKEGYNNSDDTVQIIKTSIILIKCDLVSGGYVNGIRQGILYSFPSMLVPVGYKLNITPPNMLYLMINRKEISSVHFEVTNQYGEILDLKGEEIGLAIHIEQV